MTTVAEAVLTNAGDCSNMLKISLAENSKGQTEWQTILEPKAKNTLLESAIKKINMTILET